MFSFLPLLNNSVITGLSFFIIKHISSHIIKNNYYFTLLIWVGYFNAFINIIHMLLVFNKRLESLKCFKPVLSLLLIKN